jgi:scavenger receptor class B, member 1
MPSACCSMTAQKNWLVISCTITLLLALIIGLLWPTISIRYMLRPQLVLKNGSINYENWKETPIPMYLEIYFWNYTNPEEITNYQHVKPKFEQFGPYVFLEKHIRTNVTWSEDGDTVDFFQKRIWHFQPDLSNGTLDDEILNINPIAAVSKKLKFLNRY